jgi:hypothetical protein
MIKLTYETTRIFDENGRLKAMAIPAAPRTARRPHGLEQFREISTGPLQKEPKGYWIHCFKSKEVKEQLKELAVCRASRIKSPKIAQLGDFLPRKLPSNQRFAGSR